MQVETETNMKSQVAGVRRSRDEVEPGRKNKKRIKLSHNSEENNLEQNVMHESNSMENFDHSGNNSNISDHSEVSNGQFIDTQENGLFPNVQEKSESDHLNFNGSSSNGHELIHMENMNNNTLNGNNLSQNERETESISMDSNDSEYLPPPTLIQYNDTYQYASNTFHTVNETENTSIPYEESNKRDGISYSKDELTCNPVNDCEETDSNNIPEITQSSNSETVLSAVSKIDQPSNFETILSNDSEIIQSSSSETIMYEVPESQSCSETVLSAVSEMGQPSNFKTILSNDSEIIQSSSSETILYEVPEITQSSCSETNLKITPDIKKQSSRNILQIPSCSHEINTSKSDEQLQTTVSQDDVKYLGIYDLKTTQLEGHADVIFSVAANDNIVLSSSGDTTIKMWDIENQKEVHTFSGHSDAVTAILLLNHDQSKKLCEKLGYSEVSSILISASMDCHFKVWSVCDAKEMSSVYTYNSITCIGYLESESCVVIGTEGGKIEVWDLCEKKSIDSTLAHKSSISGLEVHENYVFSISIDGAVKIWLFEDGELQPLYCRRRRETSQNGVDLGPTQWKSIAVNGDILFLGDSTPFLKTLNWRLGRLKLLVNQLGRIGECDAVLAKENILLSTSYSSSTDTAAINVWSLPDMMYIGTLTGDVQDIYCLAMTQFENKLRIISGGHQLTVWDFNLREPPKENSNSSFTFCELEGLGTEVYDKPVEHTIPVNTSPSKSKDKEDQGRCIIL